MTGSETLTRGARVNSFRVTSMIRRRVSAALSARAVWLYERLGIDFFKLIGHGVV
jgi:hypothetical protein